MFDLQLRNLVPGLSYHCGYMKFDTWPFLSYHCGYHYGCAEERSIYL